MLPKARQVLWLPSHKDLPNVSPTSPIGSAREPQGMDKSRAESVIVQPPESSPGKQFIWQPEKAEQLNKDVSAPNMIAIEAMAPKPAPKAFLPPQSVPPRIKLQPELIQGPDLDIKMTKVAETSAYPFAAITVAKPKPRNFIPPKDKPKLPVEAVAVSEVPPDVGLAAGSINEPASGTFFRESANRPNVAKPRPRQFVLPQSGTGRSLEGERGVVLETPPTVATGDKERGTVTAAVIGLEPGIMSGRLPDGSRLSSFSRAPRTGEPASGPLAGGLSTEIPGVSIQGSEGSPITPPAVPMASSNGVSFEIQLPAVAPTLSAPLQPSSRRIPRLIESRFPDRAVYTLVVAKPSLPEYNSDWTIWFAERNPPPGAPVLIRAPLPVRKLLPQGADGSGIRTGDSWVQLTAMIDKDGRLESVMPLPGKDLEAALQAARDIAQWEFRPAVRNGVPVAVEVIIEMSFRSALRLGQQE